MMVMMMFKVVDDDRDVRTSYEHVEAILLYFEVRVINSTLVGTSSTFDDFTREGRSLLESGINPLPGKSVQLVLWCKNH